MEGTLESVPITQAPATRKLRPLYSLLPYVRPYGRQIALALLFLTLSAGATLALPAAVRGLVDHGLTQPAGIELAARMAEVRLRFLELFAVAVALAVFTAARFYMVSWIGERVTADLRRAVYAHVLRQSPQFFETLKTGEVLSRLTADATVIQGAVGSSLSMGLRSLVMVLGAIGMLVATNPRLMLAVIGVITLVVLPALGIGRRVRRLSRASQDRIADTSGIAGEVLNAVPVVQSYTQENAETLRFARANEIAFATSVRRRPTVERRTDHYRPALRQAVAFRGRNPESRLDRVEQLFRCRRRADLQPLQRGKVEALDEVALLQQQREHRRHAARMGAAIAGERPQKPTRLEIWQQHDRAAGAQQRLDGAGHRILVI